MTTLAHLSDLHFGRINRKAVSELVSDLNRDRPSLVVVSGDFTMGARTVEFRKAREFLDRIDSPTLCVAGNHDIPGLGNLVARFLFPLRKYRIHIEEDLMPVFRSEDAIVIGANTARRAGWHPDWSRGRIGKEQISQIVDRLDEADDSLVKIVVTHHPFIYGNETKKRGIVGRSKRALQRFADAGVDLLLAGHLHKTFTGYAVTSHHMMKKILVAQASTATSTRLKSEPNAYNWICLERGRIGIENRIWSGEGYTEGEMVYFQSAHCG